VLSHDSVGCNVLADWPIGMHRRESGQLLQAVQDAAASLATPVTTTLSPRDSKLLR